MRPRRRLPTVSSLLVLALRIAVAVPIAVDVTTGRFVGAPFFKWVVFLFVHPAIVWLVLGVRLSPWQVVWTSSAPALHALGGVYDLYRQWWWLDHVTHLLAASCIAALVYTLVTAYARRDDTRTLTRGVVSAVIVTCTMLVGVGWEVYELRSPVLTVYGAEDTVKDLVFDAVGAVLVSTFGPRYLQRTVTEVVSRFERVRQRRLPDADVVYAAARRLSVRTATFVVTVVLLLPVEVG